VNQQCAWLVLRSSKQRLHYMSSKRTVQHPDKPMQIYKKTLAHPAKQDQAKT
jgi:hypothetical protein